jgi:nitrile hydratase
MAIQLGDASAVDRDFREEIAVSDHHHSPDHDHTEPPSDLVLRVQALDSLLIEKGLVDPAAIDVLIDTYETKIGPRNGANVVARAWGDSESKQWLLRDATAAIASLSYTGRQGEHMKVVENTPTVHNLVVCTLYPMLVLSMAGAGPAARLVQIRAIPGPCRRGSSRCVGRIRYGFS